MITHCNTTFFTHFLHCILCIPLFSLHMEAYFLFCQIKHLCVKYCNGSLCFVSWSFSLTIDERLTLLGMYFLTIVKWSKLQNIHKWEHFVVDYCKRINTRNTYINIVKGFNCESYSASDEVADVAEVDICLSTMHLFVQNLWDIFFNLFFLKNHYWNSHFP